MKVVVSEALTSVRKELVVLRDQSDFSKSGLAELTERIREALTMYSNECDRRLREREQELTVDHELEMGDIKKLMQSRDEEIRIVKRTLLEKETVLAEYEHFSSVIRQKLDDEHTDIRNLQSSLHRQMDETLEQTRIVEKANDEMSVEIASLTNSLTQCQKRIKELEENLAAARTEQQKMVKESTEKLLLESKAEFEAIRNRFKLMERSPSDSSLEKIEVIKFV